MSTITVKQFVMLLTSQSIVSCASHIRTDSGMNPYKYATPIMHIHCSDGTVISVQAHGGAHVVFKDVAQYMESFSYYSPTFGRDLAMCETDCEDLNQYGIDDIEDIEAYVESHGGIDIQKTTEEAVNKAIKCLERYK